MFGEALDEMPQERWFWLEKIKNYIYEEDWFDVLDLMEEEVRLLRGSSIENRDASVEALTTAFNNVFEKFLVGYRFLSGKIAPLDSPTEVETVESSISAVEGIPAARDHLKRAVEHLSDRQAPDYPNSIKESVSAVESLCRTVTGEKTLGSALKRLEQSGTPLHPALREAWLKMYGWASDADGIRHGGLNAADIDQALAKYVLVTSSAFIAYLMETARKAS